ncbi:uncharacterized protein G2W53_039958 [Senna tora]|uniref:Uncharacterized protein n=1 Tax=Senna tora TaxID=362788 RepID=A0A834SU57_9FABA|nr:uncharacterized protein G2W53_039958 [Senna tora]
MKSVNSSGTYVTRTINTPRSVTQEITTQNSRQLGSSSSKDKNLAFPKGITITQPDFSDETCAIKCMASRALQDISNQSAKLSQYSRSKVTTSPADAKENPYLVP